MDAERFHETGCQKSRQRQCKIVLQAEKGTRPDSIERPSIQRFVHDECDGLREPSSQRAAILYDRGVVLLLLRHQFASAFCKQPMPSSREGPSARSWSNLAMARRLALRRRIACAASSSASQHPSRTSDAKYDRLATPSSSMPVASSVNPNDRQPKRGGVEVGRCVCRLCMIVLTFQPTCRVPPSTIST